MASEHVSVRQRQTPSRVGLSSAPTMRESVRMCHVTIWPLCEYKQIVTTHLLNHGHIWPESIEGVTAFSTVPKV